MPLLLAQSANAYSLLSSMKKRRLIIASSALEKQTNKRLIARSCEHGFITLSFSTPVLTGLGRRALGRDWTCALQRKREGKSGLSSRHSRSQSPSFLGHVFLKLVTKGKNRIDRFHCHATKKRKKPRK